MVILNVTAYFNFELKSL